MGKFLDEAARELILHVRQVAWLTALPRHKLSTGEEIRQPARAEAYKTGGTEPPLPPKGDVAHVFDWFMELGQIEVTGMGRAALSWREIDAWASRTFTPMTAWEARLLRRLSVAFLAESGAAESPYHPAPWVERITSQAARDAAERQLRSVLG
ncbi:hypothetical protein PQ455_07435 [Sphingomonas naphthae]|uniref:DUF2384 domain-containing protein n=1 Tax=Sphingomonas naphthae TaxID=1813468 RepID=A0ABY7TPT3_9SPHN|nr:hypothetical protein [Sphingomonas naphthae]WCT75038.1 hypothetical protein PQ455_07435 [Sphingomonas naphthae]